MTTWESKSKQPDHILSHRISIRKYMPNLLPVPEELGKSAARMERRTEQVGFSYHV